MAITIPNSFSPDTTILSAQVNENFDTIAEKALDKTGDTLTGTLITQLVKPDGNASRDLGTSAARWATIYGTALDLTAGLDAADLTGQVPATSLGSGTPSSSTFLRGDLAWTAVATGKVLQVVQGTYATATTNATTSYADTGLTATITPSATTSKVLAVVTQSGVAAFDVGGAAIATVGLDIELLRGVSTLITPIQSGYALLDRQSAQCGFSYLDAPNSTSALTYKTRFKLHTGAAANDRARVQIASSTSTIILIEIGA